MTRLAPLGDDGDVLNEHQPHAKCRALLLSAAVMACVGLFGQRMEPARAHVSDWSYMVIHQKPNGLCQPWTELVARACRTGFNMIYLFRTLCQCLKALVPNNNKKCQKVKKEHEPAQTCTNRMTWHCMIITFNILSITHSTYQHPSGPSPTRAHCLDDIASIA